jgi:hypothetical protein
MCDYRALLLNEHACRLRVGCQGALLPCAKPSLSSSLFWMDIAIFTTLRIALLAAGRHVGSISQTICLCIFFLLQLFIPLISDTIVLRVLEKNKKIFPLFYTKHPNFLAMQSANILMFLIELVQ